MKLKHVVIVSDEELNALFDLVMQPCVASYSTMEEQAQAVAAAKINFETLLNRYVHKAFKLGKKIAKLNADSKDDAMYGADEVPPAIV